MWHVAQGSSSPCNMLSRNTLSDWLGRCLCRARRLTRLLFLYFFVWNKESKVVPRHRHRIVDGQPDMAACAKRKVLPHATPTWQPRHFHSGAGTSQTCLGTQHWPLSGQRSQFPARLSATPSTIHHSYCIAMTQQTWSYTRSNAYFWGLGFGQGLRIQNRARSSQGVEVLGTALAQHGG